MRNYAAEHARNSFYTIRQKINLLSYAFFWVVPRGPNFICWCFGTLCLFHLHRWIPICLWSWNRQCSETSAHKIQMPGNYPEESIRHPEYSESLISRRNLLHN